MPEVAGGEYWYVIYKAIGDFSDLMKDAALARAEMAALNKSITDGSNAQVLAANKSAQAQQQDIDMLKKRTAAYDTMAISAERANRQTMFGGRSDMSQHLADLSQESNWQNLLLRQRNLGFTSPQAAYSWRQMELQQAYLLNRARFGATSSGTGFTTPNEYLAFLQKQYTAMNQENQAWLRRAALYKQNADAALSYATALRGHATTFGTLGEASSSSVGGLQAYQNALLGIPESVHTRLEVDDTEAMAKLARDRQALLGIPRVVTTTEVLTSAASMGGVPIPGALPAEEVIKVSLGGPYEHQLAELASEIVALSRARVNIPVEFDLPAAAEVATLMHSLPVVGATQRINLVPSGGAVGVGAGPGGLAATAAGLAGIATASGAAAAGTKKLGAAADEVAPKLRELNTAGMHMMGWMRVLTNDVPLFAGVFGSRAVIGSLGLWHILLDLIIESLVILTVSLVTMVAALAAWGVAAAKTFIQVYNQMKNVLTVSSALNENVKPLKGTFQELVNAVRPQVFEALGIALDMISGKTGTFQELAIKTGDTLNRMFARLQVNMQGGGEGMKIFLETGETMLAIMGRIFQGLGHIFAAVLEATSKTRIAELLLYITEAFAKLAQILTIIPPNALAAVLALHGFIVWGGVITTLLGKVGVYFAGLISAIGPLNGVMAGLASHLGATDKQLVRIAEHAPAIKAVSDNLGVTAANAGAFATQLRRSGYTVDEYVKSNTKMATQMERFGVGLNKSGREAIAMGVAMGSSNEALEKMAQKLKLSNAEGAGLGATLSNLWKSGKLGTAGLWGLVAAAGAFAYMALSAKTNTQSWINSMNDGLVKSNMLGVVSQTVSDLAATTQQLTNTQGMSAQSVHALRGAHDDLQQKLGLEITRVGQVARLYGTDFVGALNLLNVAGVKTTDLFTKNNLVWATALEQVHGLVEGYKAMGQQTGMIGRDLDALLLSESSQIKAMETLNKAWDGFQKLVSDPQDQMIKLGMGMIGFAKDAGEAGASMYGLSKASLTLQKDFQSNYLDVQKLFDAFRNTQAAGYGGNFEKFVKNAVAVLIPLAGANKAAAAEISSLAQQAGGPATTNLAELSKWAGKTKDPLKTLYDMSIDASAGISDLSADAAKLTDTLQKDLNPAMAAAIFSAKGGGKPFQDMAKAFQDTGAYSGRTADAASKVAQELVAVSGNVKNAHTQFIGFATAMGISRERAEELWKSAQKVSTQQYKVQLTDNIHEQQDKIAKLREALAKETDPAKRRKIQIEIQTETKKLNEMKDKLADASQSASDLRKGLADSAKASDDLTKSGFWAQRGDYFRENMRQMGDWFTRVLPNAVTTAGKSIGTFFTKTVPDFFTGVGDKIHDIWDGAWKTVINPVKDAFIGVQSWIAQNFDKWWAKHGDDVKKVWNNVCDFFREKWDAAWGFITGAGDVFSQWWSNFTGGLHDAWDAFISFLKKNDISQVIGAGIKLLGPVLSGIWNDIIYPVFKVIWEGIKTGFQGLWEMLKLSWKVLWDTLVFIVNVVLDILSGDWKGLWDDLKNYAIQIWNAFKDFAIHIWNLIKNFAITAWGAIWGGFWRTIGAPLSDFFTKSIPRWWSSLVGGARLAWNNVWKFCHDYLVSPVSNFFTKSIPSWFGGLVTSAKNTWDSVFNWFKTKIINPIGDFFSKTIPNSIQNAFKTGINWVIGKINWVITKVGIPAIPTLAAGGPPPGGTMTSATSPYPGGISGRLAHGGSSAMAMAGSVDGAGDADSRLALVMPGEWVLRKPARMALQAKYGPDFLPTLNYADRWLGGGSRGIAASQNGPGSGVMSYAFGGAIGDWLGKYVGSPIADVAKTIGSGLGSAVAAALKNIPGLRPLFDKVWGLTIAPFVKLAANDKLPGKLTALGANKLKDGIDALLGAADSKTQAIGWQQLWKIVQSSGIPSLSLTSGYRPQSYGSYHATGNAIDVGSWDTGSTDPKTPMNRLYQWLHDNYRGSTELIHWPYGGIKDGRDVAGSFWGMQSWLAHKNHVHWAMAGLRGAGPAYAPGTPASGSAAQAQAFAKSILWAYGWGMDQWPALQALWNAESGWNANAVNPSSGAYGIPQALGKGHPYNLGDYANQIRWGLAYISERYGSPNAAWAFWQRNHWYPMGGEHEWGAGSAGPAPLAGGGIPLLFAGGGDFPSAAAALKGAYGRESNAFYNLLGKTLPAKGVTTANRTAWAKWKSAMDKQQLKTFGVGRRPPGAFGSMNLSAPGKTTAGQWQNFINNLSYLIREQEGIGIKGGINPPGTPANSGYVPWHFFRSQWQATLNAMRDVAAKADDAQAAWGGVTVPGMAPEWTDEAGSNAGAIGSLNTAIVSAESPAFWALMGMKLPTSATKAHRTALTAWDRVLTGQQYKTFGLGHSPPGDWARIYANVENPTKITSGQWDTFQRDVDYFVKEQAGTGIKGGINPPGTPKNSGWVAWHYFHNQWQALRDQLLKVQSRIPLARKVWGNIYGPGHLPYTPGPDKTPPTATPMPPGLAYNLKSLILGGPESPVFGAMSTSPDMGFPGGGTFDPGGFASSLGHMAFGGPAGLDQVGAMFSGVMPTTMVMPVFMPGGIPDSTLRRLSGLRVASDEAPRRLSPAGAAHKAAFNVEQLTINNPVAEQPSQSIARATNRLAFYAGRGLG